MEPFHDVLVGAKRVIDGLLDGKGSVELVDVSPRLCPRGYGPEYMMIQAARTSFGLGLKDPVTDRKLLRYLLVNSHTSPIEICNVTFRLVLPIPIAVHFLRHRTGRFNMFSARYAEVVGENHFYNPAQYQNGIRASSKLDKQGSEKIDPKKTEVIQTLLEKANRLAVDSHQIYHELN